MVNLVCRELISKGSNMVFILTMRPMGSTVSMSSPSQLSKAKSRYLGKFSGGHFSSAAAASRPTSKAHRKNRTDCKKPKPIIGRDSLISFHEATTLQFKTVYSLFLSISLLKARDTVYYCQLEYKIDCTIFWVCIKFV